jgi:two-component system, OmpR family, response regulator ResD
MPRGTILVVDDEPTIARVVAGYLQREGYDALTASDGPTAVAADAKHHPDLVVLDVMLPGYDGLQVMAHLRRTRAVPVILLTARGEESDRVLGLRLGADDYVVKPFSPAELVARVGAVLRRAEPEAAGGEPIQMGRVVIDPAARVATVDGEPVELTAREFDLLLHLARNPGRVFTRDELMQAVWRQSVWSDTATVTVHVRRLRQKIEIDPLQPAHLRTVWGIGYKLVP